MEPDDLPCSRNARSQKTLVERAQLKIIQPPSLGDNEQAWKEGRESPDYPSCSQNAHGETVLVQCAQ